MKLFEAFPTLEFNEDITDILADVEVIKVTTNSAKTRLRVYILSKRLIPKQIIFELEAAFVRQLPPFRTMDVHVVEKYELSGQYNQEKLWGLYQESILEELKRESIFDYDLLKKAKVRFTAGDRMELTVPDGSIARDRIQGLREYLHMVFFDRCGFEIGFDVIYQEVKHEAKDTPVVYIEEKSAEENGEAVQKADIQKTDAQSAATATGDMQDNKHSVKEAAKDKKEDENKKFRSVKQSDNPDVIYGRDFDDEATELGTITHEIGESAVRGKIRGVEIKELKSGKNLLTFGITDFTDSISIKIFLNTKENVNEIKDSIVDGAFVKVKGVIAMDAWSKELAVSSVRGIKKIPDFTVKRKDNAEVKRVELHCHTKMSDMDGVSEVSDIIKQAAKWGMPAIAITDHGVCQAFPDANHTVEKLKDFKVIYGVEAYLVDDLKSLIEDPKGQSFDDTYVVFDLETTGFSSEHDKIIEIGAVKYKERKRIDSFSCFINPEIPIPFRIEKLTGINDSMVIDAETIEQVLPRFIDFCEGAVLVAHNADFDSGFIKEKAKQVMGVDKEYTVVDTVALARVLLPQLNRYKLDTVAKAVGVSLENHHRAVDDADCCAGIFMKFIDMMEERGINNLDEVESLSEARENIVKKLPSYHAIILAKNDIGRTNLYRLTSMAHLQYFNRRPRVPKSELLKHREGLILGSACEAGELYRAILDNKSDQDIARLVEFYDYLEIQPLGNNNFMIDAEDIWVSSKEDLININKRIVALGEQFGKPVVATCDVHFLNPEDEVYRRIIMAGQGFEDADHQAPLYLHTTDEMLEEFQYLGNDKAYEVVVKNTNLIADMCEKISPVRPDKCPPVIENSDATLREICYTTAHEMYGKDLPQIVVERLERELNSIISNGYSVMYIIAQKLVWKSNEDGYLVGSRGSVGSSLAATMAGITEVNPLPPHYLCRKCYYCDFDSEEVKKFSGGAGCDMPDKICPVCGEPLTKQGFDIPFETFLGFKGNKEPDIDLNFSGEYQSKAHSYTEVIFGKGQTFKAGTVGTVADKTAYGYVRKYFEERGITKRDSEIVRISEGCTGIRRSTGQHPGGIIVLPLGEEIHTFTPIQHPANDMTTNIVTTHFDYHSIDHNLLKLDILGHDDPTMIRMLQDLTGIDPKTIPLDSPEVMSLFQNTSALGITPDDIGGTKLGALGIPEFGTDFAMQMVIDAKPTCFADLVRISGLSHGTDVWLGNAQTLIMNGTATISTAICCRDDIMIYLISKGMDKELSFTIMESVRKGKGLKDGWPEQMLEHDVPQWYIESCLKIKYMFPKAHAAAYVMMAWRIAYCKVFYPLAYYAAYFSIRATAFSYELMCMGKDKLNYYIADYKKRSDSLSKKEEDTLKDMRLVQEMYARGFEFLPIDLYKSHSRNFQIVDGKLLPPFNSIDGLGDVAAELIMNAAEQGKFLSKDDFQTRTKASKTVVALMSDLGILDDLPQSNQLSLFDMM